MAKWALILLVLVVAAGCQSDGSKTAGKAAERMKELGQTIDAGDKQIDSTMIALNAMRDNPEGDLVAMFNTYRNDLAKLEDLAKKAGKKRDALHDKKDEYFEQWEKSLEQIQSESMREISTERKANVMKAFEEVQVAFDATQTAFDPLLANLQDIRTMLTNDLNSAGVKALDKVIQQANVDAEKTRKTLTGVEASFEELAAQIAPPEKQPEEK